jgi:hypothetical protein
VLFEPLLAGGDGRMNSLERTPNQPAAGLRPERLGALFTLREERVLADPAPVMRSLPAFFLRRHFESGNMTAAIDPALYRQRGRSAGLPES